MAINCAMHSVICVHIIGEASLVGGVASLTVFTQQVGAEFITDYPAVVLWDKLISLSSCDITMKFPDASAAMIRSQSSMWLLYFPVSGSKKFEESLPLNAHY